MSDFGLECRVPVPSLGLKAGDFVSVRPQHEQPVTLIRPLRDDVRPLLAALEGGAIVPCRATVQEASDTLVQMLPGAPKRRRFRFRADGRADLQLVR